MGRPICDDEYRNFVLNQLQRLSEFSLEKMCSGKSSRSCWLVARWNLNMILDDNKIFSVSTLLCVGMTGVRFYLNFTNENSKFIAGTLRNHKYHLNYKSSFDF